jgi:hypothetical protein
VGGEEGVSPATGVLPGAGCFVEVGAEVSPGAGLVPGVVCFVVVGAEASPATGVVPGAGCAVGALPAGVLEGLVWEVDCAHSAVAITSAASAPALVA